MKQPRAISILSWLILLASGAGLGVGVYTFYYARGGSYLSDDPRACVNCHVMRDSYDGWQKSSHHAVATCNDCHVPHDLLGKYLAKAANGYHHSKAFTFQDFAEPIRIKPANADGSRNEMRSFVCGQCHVEYYCSTKLPLVFPWGKGLKVEEQEAFWNELRFPDGQRFFDYKHAETGAEILKAQHPEYELWSQGIHARSGVSCADCHMPYIREGAAKISDHWVRSPLLNVNRSCQTCHHFPEQELLSRVEVIQNRNHDLLQRSARALMDLLDAIQAAKAAGVGEEALKPALELQRSAQWRIDFIAAENSMGFHAPQEAARILGEAIDLARQGEIAARAKVPQGGNP